MAKTKSYNPASVKQLHVNKWRGIHHPDPHANMQKGYVGYSDNSVSRRIRQLQTRYGLIQRESYANSIKHTNISTGAKCLAEGTNVWFEARNPEVFEPIDDRVITPEPPTFGDPDNPYIPGDPYWTPDGAYVIYDHSADHSISANLRLAFNVYGPAGDAWYAYFQNVGPGTIPSNVETTYPNTVDPSLPHSWAAAANDWRDKTNFVPWNNIGANAATNWNALKHHDTEYPDQLPHTWNNILKLTASVRTYGSKGITTSEMTTLESRFGRKPDMLLEFNNASAGANGVYSGDNPSWNVLVPAETLAWETYYYGGTKWWFVPINYRIQPPAPSSGYPTGYFVPSRVMLVGDIENPPQPITDFTGPPLYLIFSDGRRKLVTHPKYWRVWVKDGGVMMLAVGTST